jgi:hypothetical protein
VTNFTTNRQAVSGLTYESQKTHREIEMESIKLIDPNGAFNSAALRAAIAEGQSGLDKAVSAGITAYTEAVKSPVFGKEASDIMRMASALMGPRAAAIWFIDHEPGVGSSPATQLASDELRGPFVQRFTQYANTEGMRKLAALMGM